MKHISESRKGYFRGLALVVTLALGLITIIGSNGGGGGDGGNGGQTDLSDVTSTEAVAAASKSLTDVTDDAADALGTLAVQSSALEISINPLAFPAVCSIGDTTAEQLEGMVLMAQLLLKIGQAFLVDGLMGIPVRESGNRISMTPDPTQCDDPEDTAEEIAACKDTLTHFSIVQTLTSKDSGIMEYRFDEWTMVVVGYTSVSVYFELDLGELRDMLPDLLVALGVEGVEVPELPQTFTGRVRITLTRLGEKAASVAVEVTQAINIAGQMDGEEMDIQLATGKLLELSADGVAGTGSLATDVGAIDAMFYGEDENSNTFPVRLTLAGLSGLIQLSNQGKDLTVSNAGLKGQPLVVTVDENPGTEALKVSVNTLGWTVDGEAMTFTSDQALNLSLSMNNDHGYMGELLDLVDLFGLFADRPDPNTWSNQGTLTVSAPKDTKLQVIHVTEGTCMAVLQVLNGNLYVTGTSYFGDQILNVSAPGCFTKRTGTDPGLPIVEVTCPSQ